MVRSSEAQVRGEIRCFEFEIKGPESGQSAWHSDDVAPSYGGSQHRFRNCGFGCPKFGRAHSPTSPHPATPNTPHRCTPTLIGGPVVRESGLVYYNPDAAAENSDSTAENSDCTAEYSDVMADTSQHTCTLGPEARTPGTSGGQPMYAVMWGPGPVRQGPHEVNKYARLCGAREGHREINKYADLFGARGPCDRSPGRSQMAPAAPRKQRCRSSTEIRAGHLQRYGPVIYRDTCCFIFRDTGRSSAEIRWCFISRDTVVFHLQRYGG